jgi:hypothetical protein
MKYFRNFDKQADAIGVKAYIPTVAIVGGGVDKVGFFNGDPSKEYIFGENGDFINVEEKETRVICTYNVTSTTEETHLLYSGLTLSEIASMEVDGVNATVATGYTFTTTGTHTVKYTFKDNTWISNKAFQECTALISVTIPSSVINIGSYAFKKCTGLASIVIPDSVINMGSETFSSCTGLTSVVIPDSVTFIYGSAFYGCTSLTSAIIGNGLTSINALFSGCTSLTSVTIGNSVTSICSQSFYNCSGLTSVVIPDSVTSIDYAAFSGCAGLTSVTIGSGVTEISDEVFWFCESLATINYTGTKSQWKAINRAKDWHAAVPATKVTCSDGDCGLDDTTA